MQPKHWLAQARADMESAGDNVTMENYDVAALYAHQAVEKALKGLQLQRDGEHTKTHNLPRLAEQLDAPERIHEHTADLNPIYILAQYPGAAEAIPAELYDETDATAFCDHAEEVLAWVETNWT